MSVTEDLIARKEKYSAAIDVVNEEIAKVNALDIPDNAREFYDAVLAENNEKLKILQEKYNEIDTLLPCIAMLLTNDDKYIISPNTFEVAKNATELPAIAFKVTYENGSEETEVTFKATAFGVKLVFEHDGTQYVVVEKEGDFVAPTRDYENVYLLDGSERDEEIRGRKVLRTSDVEALASEATDSLTIEDKYITKLRGIQYYSSLKSMTFINCEFGDLTNAFTMFGTFRKTDGYIYYVQLSYIEEFKFINCVFPEAGVLNFTVGGKQSEYYNKMNPITSLTISNASETLTHVYMDRAVRLEHLSITDSPSVEVVPTFNNQDRIKDIVLTHTAIKTFNIRDSESIEAIDISYTPVTTVGLYRCPILATFNREGCEKLKTVKIEDCPLLE